MLKTNRSYIKCILLSFITLGIYGLFMTSRMAKDANLADTKGKKVGGLLFFIFASIFTVGIYDIYWFYKVTEKFADVVRSDGKTPIINGGGFLLWTMLGSLIIVGPFIAMARLIKMWNQSNAIYNARQSGAAAA